MRRTYEVAGRTDKRAMREFLKREETVPFVVEGP